MAESRPIATLTLVNERNRQVARDVISIWPKQEFVLGCKHLQQHVDDHDSTISRRHVVLRCVQFDEDTTAWSVPPMVYAEDLSMNGTVLVRDSSAEDGSPVRLDHQLTKSMGPVLLHDGDCLYFTKSTFLKYRELDPVTSSKMSFIMSCEVKRFEEEFSISPRLIGTGGQGRVFVAWDHHAGQQVACKVVSTAGMELDRDQDAPTEASNGAASRREFKAQSTKLQRKLHKFEVEYDILKDLSHPNIIDMRKVFITTHHIYIMQELMAGGDLFSYISRNGDVLSESLSAVNTRQLLKAVDYLHSNGIVHRDIKPENILMSSWESGTRVVLTDFGMAKRIKANTSTSQYNTLFRMFSYCGTYGFVAPEVNRLNPTIAENKGYSCAIDMWSVGTVTALMLTGNLAFDRRDSDEDMGQVNVRSHSVYDLSAIAQGKQKWEIVSKRARDFVMSLLVLQEDKRLTAKRALEHSWFTNHICAASFDAVYQKAVADWKPRSTHNQSIVESVDTSDIAVPTPSASQAVRQRSASAIIQSEFFQAVGDDDNRSTILNHGPITEQELDNNLLLAASPASPIASALEDKPSSSEPSSSAKWGTKTNHYVSSYSRIPSQTLDPDSGLDKLDLLVESIPPQSSDPDQDLDNLKPSAQLRNPQPSLELPWPSSPPNKHRKRFRSVELPWPSQPPKIQRRGV